MKLGEEKKKKAKGINTMSCPIPHGGHKHVLNCLSVV